MDVTIYRFNSYMQEFFISKKVLQQCAWYPSSSQKGDKLVCLKNLQELLQTILKIIFSQKQKLALQQLQVHTSNFLSVPECLNQLLIFPMFPTFPITLLALHFCFLMGLFVSLTCFLFLLSVFLILHRPTTGYPCRA